MAAGLGLIAVLALQAGAEPLERAPAALWALTGLLLFSELMPIKVPRGGIEEQINTSSPFSFSLLLVVGPVPTVFVAAAASLVAHLMRREPVWKAGFAVARHTFALSAAGALLEILGRTAGRTGSFTGGAHFAPQDLPRSVVAAAAFLFVNLVLTGLLQALDQRASVPSFLHREVAFQASIEGALLALALVVVVLVNDSLLFLPIVVLPLLGIYKGAEQSLRSARSEERFRSLVQNAADVICILDGGGMIRYRSPSVESILGFRVDQVAGPFVSNFVHPDDARVAQAAFEDALQNPNDAVRCEIRCRSADGSWRYLEAIWNNLLDNPSVEGVVVNARDVTARKALEEQLSHQAFHDPLTGLPNRALFEDRVEHALARLNRGGSPIAVLYVDLDNFKTVNDSLGHAVGDELVCAVAERLPECVRAGDTIARFGGDEFAVLLEDGADLRRAKAVARRIIDAIRSPFLLRGREIFVGASVGIAVGRSGEVGAEELLRNADVAMYLAKGQGKGRFEVFEPSMHEAAVRRLELRAELQRAIEKEDFILLYQPILDLATKETVGAEALVRWRHRRRGLIAPGEFIPLAEETGLIVPLGRWVMRAALRQAAAWRKARPGFAVSLNLSARQLQEPAVVDEIRAALDESGADPSSIILEITESVMMEDVEETIELLWALKGLGVRLAIDDFGTGFSSLSYLKRLPIDILKVDKGFVDGVGNGPEDSAFCRAIVKLAHTMQRTVIAEGIETPRQAAELRAMGCDLGQGHLFAPAVEPAEIVASLPASRPRRRRARAAAGARG